MGAGLADSSLALIYRVLQTLPAAQRTGRSDGTAQALCPGAPLARFSNQGNGHV